MVIYHPLSIEKVWFLNPYMSLTNSSSIGKPQIPRPPALIVEVGLVWSCSFLPSSASYLAPRRYISQKHEFNERKGLCETVHRNFQSIPLNRRLGPHNQPVTPQDDNDEIPNHKTVPYILLTDQVSWALRMITAKVHNQILNTNHRLEWSIIPHRFRFWITNARFCCSERKCQYV